MRRRWGHRCEQQRQRVRDFATSDKDADIAKSDKDGDIAVSDKVGYIAVSDRVGYIAVSDKVGYIAVSDKVGYIAVSDKDGDILMSTTFSSWRGTEPMWNSSTAVPRECPRRSQKWLWDGVLDARLG